MAESSNSTTPNKNSDIDGSAKGPLTLILAPDFTIWRETRRLIADKGSRVEDISTCASQDPVIVLELLKVANALYFSGGRSAICSVKTAVVRLGSDVVIELLEDMKSRQSPEDEDVAKWLEIQRARCRRTSIVARILSEAVARQFADECQVAGLFSYLGEMLATLHLKEKFVEIADNEPRGKLLYRLGVNLNFDVEKIGLSYLRKYGVPENLLFALDREARPRAPDRAIMRPVCQAAAELVEAFEADKWEKLAPGRVLAPKSSIRMLQLPDSMYLKIYERAAEYLFAEKIAAQHRSKESYTLDALAEAVAESQPSEEADDLSADINRLLQSSAAPQPATAEIPVARAAPAAAPAPAVLEAAPTAEQFNFSRNKKKAKPRISRPQPAVPPPPLRTEVGNQVVAAITSSFENAANSEELLLDLLDRLVLEADFAKAALICISRDRTQAIVVAARGETFGNGQRLSLDDPLSPLAQCFSKVQSFGNRGSSNSPFGSRAYALAPIDVDHETPVALYADCGNDGSLTFESRRIFRTVVDILNQKLPSIPGGLPVELESW